jgi:hypothetical protein
MIAEAAHYCEVCKRPVRMLVSLAPHALLVT